MHHFTQFHSIVMTTLHEKVWRLVAVCAEKLDLRSVRTQIRENRDELDHIKTAGKGRNKAAILKDLMQWLEDDHDQSDADDELVSGNEANEHDAVPVTNALSRPNEMIADDAREKDKSPAIAAAVPVTPKASDSSEEKETKEVTKSEDDIQSQQEAFNISSPIIDALLYNGREMPLVIARLIRSFTCDCIRYSVLNNSADTVCESPWPSLTMENDVALIGLMGADSSSVGTATFAVSISTMRQSGVHSEWRGTITSSQRMFGLHTRWLGRPFQVRIEDGHGEETLFECDDTPRAVFGRKGENLQSVNVRTVKAVNGFGSVLCGDGKAFDGALCDRFRIRFRTNVIGPTFMIGFAYHKKYKMNLRHGLGRGPNRDLSVGILVFNNGFRLRDTKHVGQYRHGITSQLPSDVRFPISGQIWLVEFDFVAKSLCLFLRLPNQWALATKLDFNWKPRQQWEQCNLAFSEIIPGFTLAHKNDEIEIM